MKVGDFEIKCTQCGSEDIAIVDRYSTDDIEAEKFTVMKCANCGSEVEI